MSRELKTIQTQEKLNRVFAIDEVGPGGANHEYLIVSDKGLQVPKETKIIFQKGPRKESDSTHGITNEDLLEIVRDRLISFQNGSYACDYNEHALNHVEEALHCLNARVEDRINRNVMGEYKK